MDALVDAVAGLSDDLGVARPRSGLVVGLDRDPAAKVTVLLFDASGRVTAVAKTSRRPGADGALVAEHAALSALAALPLRRVRAQVPRAALLPDVAGRAVVVTSAVPGGPLTVPYHAPGHVSSPALVAEDLAAAGSWLAAFQTDTAMGAPGCAEVFAEYALPAFDRYEAELGPDLVERLVRDRCERLAADLADVPVPLCAVHGDFAPGNVLVEQTGRRGPLTVTGVVDWELGSRCGPALTDLFKFVASYGSFLDRAAPRGRRGLRGHAGWDAVRATLAGPDPWPNTVGFLHAFTGAGWFPRLVREYLTAGYARMGVPAEVEPVFLPSFVAAQATTLSDPTYRQGYRALLHALAALPDERWGHRRSSDSDHRLGQPAPSPVGDRR